MKKKSGIDKKAYEAFEANEPAKVVKKEIKEASAKLGKKATHKDAEKLEPMAVKKKEAAKGKKLLSKKKKQM